MRTVSDAETANTSEDYAAKAGLKQMFWHKKKKPGRKFKVNLEAYPEMMAAPFLFGVWLDDPEWRAMLASAGKDVGPQTALLFLGNYMMIRLHLVAEGSSD